MMVLGGWDQGYGPSRLPSSLVRVQSVLCQRHPCHLCSIFPSPSSLNLDCGKDICYFDLIVPYPEMK